MVGFLLNGEEKAHPAGYKDNNGILEKMPGIPHTYIIDKNINLNLINPDEKIIYNPSEVYIEANDLVFPSGYTFKTVRGLYPTVDKVSEERDSSILCGMVNFGPDDRDVPIPTDLERSKYILKDGSYLTIEPCVKIFDADFLLEEGATLEYDPNQTFGNFTITADSTLATVIETTMPNNQACNDCQCMQNYDHEDEFINDELIIENETVVWTLDKRIRGQIVVKNGGTLFLNGATIEFADSKRVGIPTGITVEAGGKLEIFNARLTTLSGKFCSHEVWDGIKLHGIGDGAKDYDAELEIENSTIDNARVAIAAQGAKYENINGEVWESGGVIDAENVRFINNYVSVYATSFNPAIEFKSCIFQQTELLRDRELSETGGGFAEVVLFHLDSASFKSCRFSGLNTGELPHFAKGIGIYMLQADLTVEELEQGEVANPINQNSTFENLFSGIEYYSFAGLDDQLKVFDTDFINNVHGITDNGGDNDVIERNTFELQNFGEYEDEREDESGSTLDYNTWGTFMFGAKNYYISDNDYLIGGFGGSSSIFGIIAHNSVNSPSSVYDNDFDGHFVATQTEEENQVLSIKCNEFVFAGNRALSVNPQIGSTLFPNSLGDQGEGCGNLSALNLFYEVCSFPNSNPGVDNIWVGVLDNPFTYWPNGVAPSTQYPACHEGDVLVEDCINPIDRSTVCPEADFGGLVATWLNTYSPLQIASMIQTGGYSIGEQSQLMNTTTRLYIEGDEHNDAILFLEAIDTDHSVELLVKTYLDRSLLTLAQNKLDEMDQRSLYDPLYFDFFQLLIDVKSNGRDYEALTSQEKQTIENIADAESYAAVYAQTLLVMLNNISYTRRPQMPISGHNKTLSKTEPQEAIILYPNPNAGLVKLKTSYNEGQLYIYDIAGSQVKSFSLTKDKNTLLLDLPTGTYFALLHTIDETIYQKIIIHH